MRIHIVSNSEKHSALVHTYICTEYFSICLANGNEKFNGFTNYKQNKATDPSDFGGICNK